MYVCIIHIPYLIRYTMSQCFMHSNSCEYTHCVGYYATIGLRPS